MYLLDTGILSNLVKRTPSTALVAKLASVPRQGLAISRRNQYIK